MNFERCTKRSGKCLGAEPLSYPESETWIKKSAFA